MKRYRQSAKGQAAGRAARKKYNESPKGRAAMKRYQQSAKGRAVNRTAKKKYDESPKGRATLQALRERNKEHQKAYRESPRADGLRIGRSSPGREAAKRTLDGEDRSGIMRYEGKGGSCPLAHPPFHRFVSVFFSAFPQG